MKTHTLTLHARFGLIMTGLLLMSGALLAAGASSGPLAILAAFVLTLGAVLILGRRALNQSGAVGLGGDATQRLYTMKLTHTAAVVVGQIVVIGGRVVEACNAYASNAEGVYIYQGKRMWPKEASLVIAAWAEVYWDATNNVVTTTAAGNTPLGLCCEAAVAADTSVCFQLLPLAAGAITAPALKTRAVVALSDAPATLTATQLIDSSIFTITPSTGRALTTATAALLVAGCKGCQVGTSFDFSVVCLAAFAVTLSGGTGVTLVGSGVANNASATFRAIFTNVGSGSEAVTIYRVS